ncbi:hypothetical protein H0O02_00100 [Candidatus Micrarchaeota archaeon]|nr:hypothetical protein [Candidatus Micrarchaeota archaeon]
MKEEEVDLVEEGYEEVSAGKNANPEREGTPKAGGDAPRTGSNRPDLRVVQTDRDRDGNVVYMNVGGMWKNVSKNGNEFYTLKIGNLKLLVFPNANK